MSTVTVSPLRQRMIEDMNARKLCAGRRKPRKRAAPERSPKVAQAPLRALIRMARSAFPFNEKMAIVARLLRGEPLERVAGETNVSIARLTEWARSRVGRRGYSPERT